MSIGNFKNKKILIFGLGLLGGGVATTNWFLKQGAKVTITDLKTKDELALSLKQLKGKPELLLGGHEKINVRDYDVIVINPGVSVKHPLIQKAIKLGKPVINEATIFYSEFIGKIIGITGTRGKTTTATWTQHLLGTKAILTGNSPDHPFLQALSSKLQVSRPWAVTEMPSFQTELFDPMISPGLRRPDIAVVTNIYRDHFNRYPNYRAYVKTKANLFAQQGSNQWLILNFDNTWTPFLLVIPRKSPVWFFSVKPLPPELDGLFWKDGKLLFQEHGHLRDALDLEGFASKWGTHNIENLMAASLVAHAADMKWEDIQTRIKTLPSIPFRQEIIYQSKALTIINDTAATSPEGALAAAKRFAGSDTVLITGGTDRKLDFTKWGEILTTYIVPDHFVFLEGSATLKMLKALKFKKARIFKTLQECLYYAISLEPQTIVFSPGSKSFEKFKNEYDRGEQFNALVKKLVK